jgi:DNA-binding IclR family transcriptional regulator
MLLFSRYVSLDVLRVEDRPMRLADLFKATGFARSTVIIHLEKLMSEGLF